MPLTEVEVRQAQPGEKDKKLSDEKGMYLLIKKNGAKYWRMKYRFAGKEKTLALGVYPQVSLKMARLERDKAKLDLANGIDPSLLKQTKKIALRASHANSFQAVAEEWFTLTRAKWAESTVDKQSWILKQNLFPWIGSIPIAELEPPHILDALRRIESRGL